MSEELNPQKSKEELFKEDPDRFIDIDDLIVAVKKTEQGPALLLNQNLRRSELVNAMGEIQIATIRHIIYQDAAKAQNTSPRGSIIFHARNIFRR